MTSTKEPFNKQHLKWLRRSSPRDQIIPQAQLDHAWQTARQAAVLLRQKYQVRRIRVFGSLLYPHLFHPNSDIDLAVEGLAIQDYWNALADVLFLDKKYTIDLVDPDTCSPSIWSTVEREGVDL